MNPIRVMIVDDHAVLRSGLKLLIDSQPDMRVVGEAGGLMEALRVAPGIAPNVVTLDLSMPGPAGIAGIEQIRQAVPAARIVVLTMHDDPAYVRAALAMGALGYVNKSAADIELISALRAVSAGRVFVDCGNQAAIGMSPPSERISGSAPVESLSEREREVLREVARGNTNQQIADSVGLSIKTIESYRARLMKKLGLKQRAELVRVAIELGLLKNDPSA